MASRDVILESIQNSRVQILNGLTILKDIRSNEENYSYYVDKKRELEGQNLNSEGAASEQLSVLYRYIQDNHKQEFEILIQTFMTTTTSNLNKVFTLKQMITKKLATWRDEQRRMAIGIIKVHLVSLDKLQIWCEEIADLMWNIYEQLVEAKYILQKNIGVNYPTHLVLVQTQTVKVIKSLNDLLNESMIVEEQPPQVIRWMRSNGGIEKDLKVSMLAGRKLRHWNSSIPTAFSERIRIMNVSMNYGTGESKRISWSFRNINVLSPGQSFIKFESFVTFGSFKLKVSTNSLPFVVISHESKAVLAEALMSWEYAFGGGWWKVENGPWSEVSKILNAKFQFNDMNARGLTADNIACMARMIFGNQEPQPETITWTEMCRLHLPGRKFTFWEWIFEASKLIARTPQLKKMWNRGLIMGFIERKDAENLIKHSRIGTFLLRFPNTALGAISITVLVESGNVVSVNPFRWCDLQDKSLATRIGELDQLKYLYQLGKEIPKEDAFKDFDTNGYIANGYVQIVPRIQT